MGFKDIIRRVLQPSLTPVDAPPAASTSPETREWARAWSKAFESGELNPPRDVHDGAAWNTYWTNNLRVGAPDQGLSDIMSSDDTLIGLLDSRDVRTILCAGNGLSGEALSLAMHGFHVTTLDISSVPAEIMAGSLRRPDHPASGIPEFRIVNDVFEFAGTGVIPADACPRMHQRASRPPRSGGSLTFVVGDLLNSEICAGPFDAVIERLTVQLFPDEEREAALDRLAARLAERGLLVSHMHDGAGGPGRVRPHHAREWARSRGFVLDSGLAPEARASAKRLVRLVVTTG